MASLVRRPDRGNRWQATFRCDEPCVDAAGKLRRPGHEHARLFDRKVDAEKWLNTSKADVARGQWIDPRAGDVLVKDRAKVWRAAQMHRPTTAAHVETMIRRHVEPTFGERKLSSIKQSEVQAWATAKSGELAPATVRVVYSFLAAIFRSAMADGLIAKTPCVKITLPESQPARVEPLTTEQVEAIAAKVPKRYRALVILCAGTGIRQGEALGLTWDRVNDTFRALTVDRQLVTMPKADPYLAPPKTSASNRTIPLPQVVLDALKAHREAFPPVSSELVWRADSKAEPTTAKLVFVDDDGLPIRRTAFSAKVWRPSLRKAGVPKGKTMHDLRHYYASLLIRHGESVKTVQARLGHKNASETLDTYSHLWPDSDDRTREAVDSVLGSTAHDRKEAQ